MRDMGNLPDDAIAEILARLPIKSLSRFKCVSNSWNHLISHPSFLNLRALRKRSTRELRLIYVEHGKNTDGRIRITATDTEGKLINQFSLPGNSMKNSVDRLYPTRFDLVCFHNYRGEIWLCNPATRQILALPYPSQAVSKLDRFYGPYHNIGFGYSSSRDEYKVVQLLDFRDQNGPIFGIYCEVYSVSSEVDHHQCSSGWRKTSEKCPHPVMGAAACVQDVLHWMASDEFFQPLVAIVSFDLNEEKFRTMPVSPQWMECANLVYTIMY
ncbi:UNVERIFIED_CONTAM: F-box/kelch-repeat protein [Sesamum calycinum]|uniref:F-box/kelch-repeat protein n=1 Tax=Sesamum calycinum TaxID=2727403 RepID=A0AAW2QZC3_9LAMI